MPKNNTSHLLQLHGIVLIWGFTAVLGALISLGALPLVWYRMGIALVSVALFMIWKKKSFAQPWPVVRHMMATGVVISLHWLLFFYAIKVSNVSITLACLSTGAFFTALLEPLIYRRKLLWYEVGLGVLVILGLLLIFGMDMSYAQGMMAGLGSAFLAAVFSLNNGRLIQKTEASVICFYELGTGWLFLGVVLLFSGMLTAEVMQLQGWDLPYLIILATACTAYAFIESIRLMKFLTPYTVMLTTNMEPIYGILLAYFILGDQEQMHASFYFGAVLILFAVVADSAIKYRVKSKLKQQSAA